MMPHGSPAASLTFGTCCRIAISSCAVLAVSTRRLHPAPAVGDGRVNARHLDRVRGDALAEGEGVPLVSPPLGRDREDALALAGQVKPGGLAEPEGPEHL